MEFVALNRDLNRGLTLVHILDEKMNSSGSVFQVETARSILLAPRSLAMPTSLAIALLCSRTAAAACREYPLPQALPGLATTVAAASGATCFADRERYEAAPSSGRPPRLPPSSQARFVGPTLLI